MCQAPADCEFPCSPDEICVSGECVELPQEPPEQPPEQPPQQPSEQPPEQPPEQQPEQPPEPPEPPPTPDPEPPKPSRPPLQIGPANTNEVHRTIDTIEKESALNEARRHLEIELEEKFGNNVFKKITKITLYVVSGTELSLSDDDRAFISSQTGLPEGVLDTKLKNLFNPKIRVHGFHAKGIIVIALDKNIENGGYTLSNTLMHEVGHAVLPDRCANHPADDLVCGGVMVEYPSPGTRHQYTDQFVAEVVEKHNRQD